MHNKFRKKATAGHLKNKICAKRRKLLTIEGSSFQKKVKYVIYVVEANGEEENKMVNVLHVTKHILSKCGPMTTMKLQKLVYYCQAWSLAWDDEPLFEEDFQAWANGPVCPTLYNLHRKQFSVDASFLSTYHVATFTNTQKATMDAVLAYYADKSPHWLSELTHNEKPWVEARGSCKPGENCTNKISKQTMQSYYASL